MPVAQRAAEVAPAKIMTNTAEMLTIIMHLFFFALFDWMSSVSAFWLDDISPIGMDSTCFFGLNTKILQT